MDWVVTHPVCHHLSRVVKGPLSRALLRFDGHHAADVDESIIAVDVMASGQLVMSRSPGCVWRTGDHHISQRDGISRMPSRTEQRRSLRASKATPCPTTLREGASRDGAALNGPHRPPWGESAAQDPTVPGSTSCVTTLLAPIMLLLPMCTPAWFPIQTQSPTTMLAHDDGVSKASLKSGRRG
jgi:hypothetical protein